MKELSILFTKENRAKARSGDKIQTRRVLSSKLLEKMKIAAQCGEVSDFVGNGELRPHDESYIVDFARYTVGDYLWMLEPYRISDQRNEFMDFNGVVWGYYLDDNEEFETELTEAEFELWCDRKKPYMKTSSRFMYKSLARTWFKVTDVRVERPQSITHADIYREGVTVDDSDKANYPDNLKDKWIDLWNLINEKRGFGWEVNPWVFVYEYRRIDK